MRTRPVVNGDSPPAEREFGLRAAREGQRTTDLMSTHAASRAIAPLNGRGIGLGITELVKHLMNEGAGAMRITDFDIHPSATLPMFDDLNVSQRAWDALAHHRKAPPVARSSRAVGLAENLWEERRIAPELRSAGISIGQQH